MIKIEICSNSNKSKGNKSILIDLPASSYDLQDAFERLGVESLSKCRLKNVYTDFEAMDMLFNSMFLITDDLPALNMLASTLLEFDSDEEKIFSAILLKDQPQTIDEMVCIADRVNEAILEPIYTKKELGRFLVREGDVDIPNEESDFISYKKVADFYLKKYNCAITPYGFITDEGLRCDYCDHCRSKKVVSESFDSIWERDDSVVFELAITNRHRKKDESLFPVALFLPINDFDLKSVMKRIGAKSPEDISLADIKSRHQLFVSLLRNCADIEGLNEFAKILANMSTTTFCKYKALLEYHKIIGENGLVNMSTSPLGELIEKTTMIGQYDFVPLTREKLPQKKGYVLTSYGYINDRRDSLVKQIQLDTTFTKRR